jgi:hypothetical protein
MGFILWIVSIILGIILLPAGFLYGFIKCFWKKQIGSAFHNLNHKFLILAMAVDEYGNLTCNEILDDTLLSRRSTFPFGADGATISSVVASNYYAGTLTGFGRFVASVLRLCKDTAFKY